MFYTFSDHIACLSRGCFIPLWLWRSLSLTVCYHDGPGQRIPGLLQAEQRLSLAIDLLPLGWILSAFGDKGLPGVERREIFSLGFSRKGLASTRARQRLERSRHRRRTNSVPSPRYLHRWMIDPTIQLLASRSACSRLVRFNRSHHDGVKQRWCRL